MPEKPIINITKPMKMSEMMQLAGVIDDIWTFDTDLSNTEIDELFRTSVNGADELPKNVLSWEGIKNSVKPIQYSDETIFKSNKQELAEAVFSPAFAEADLKVAESLMTLYNIGLMSYEELVKASVNNSFVSPSLLKRLKEKQDREQQTITSNDFKGLRELNELPREPEQKEFKMWINFKPQDSGLLEAVTQLDSMTKNLQRGIRKVFHGQPRNREFTEEYTGSYLRKSNNKRRKKNIKRSKRIKRNNL